ncbi:MAG: threonine/serine exporter family protein [Gemmatimonadaceae bacterium]|nr:threonine/serine exporter family protein [Gemmatimonadaceae bacterium]
MSTGQFPLPTGQFPVPEYAPPSGEGTADPGAVGFVLRLGKALHQNGYPAHQLEQALALVARRLGLTAQFFSTPTSIFAGFGTPDRQQTTMTRVEPGDVNLARLSRLDQVMRDVLDGRATALQGSARVEHLQVAPGPYPRALTVAAFGLASGAVAVLLGGGWREILTAALLGVVTGLLDAVVAPFRRARTIFEPTAAFAVALLAALAGVWLGGYGQGIATLAGLIVLLPGLMLTTAMTELATQHLASGTARLSGALITFLSIAFGVALASKVAPLLMTIPATAAASPLPSWTTYPAIVVAALSFTVLLRAEPADAGWIVLAGALSYLSARAGRERLGPELGAFIGALVIGVASDVFARVFRRPSAITQVPGVLIIVPGSVGYRGLMSLLNDQVVVGIETAFQMALIGVSIVAGLLMSNVLVPGESFGRER